MIRPINRCTQNLEIASQHPPMIEWMAGLVSTGATWTQEHADHIVDHLRKVSRLATELVERARGLKE